MRGRQATNRRHNMKDKLNYKELWNVFWKGYYWRSTKARERYMTMFLNEFMSDTFSSNRPEWEKTYELFTSNNLKND